MDESTIQTLKEMGLTPAEAEVYVILLKLGEARVGQVINMTKISSSNVHEALEKLVQKGLVSFIMKNNIKEYSPASPNGLRVLIENEKQTIKEKETKLQNLLVNLLSIQKITEPSQNAEVYQGLSGIKSGYKKMFQRVHKGQDFLFFYKYDKLNVEIVHEFFSKMDIEDYYNRIPTRGIFTEEYKPMFKERKKNKIKAKFTKIPIPSSVNIYGDQMLIISWRENPIGFLIQSKEVTQTYKELFEEIWNS